MNKHLTLALILILLLCACGKLSSVTGHYSNSTTSVILHSNHSYSYRYTRDGLVDSVKGVFRIDHDTVYITPKSVFIDTTVTPPGTHSPGLPFSILYPQLAELAKLRPARFIAKNKKLYYFFSDDLELAIKTEKLPVMRPFLQLSYK